MMWNSWLDRELTLAGRLVLNSGEVVLARTGPIARIPQLAIHLDRDVNPGGLKLDPQKHLHPVWTVDNPYGNVRGVRGGGHGGLDDASQVRRHLILTPSQGPGFFGDKGQFIAASRQDNLSSVHPGLVALERLAAQGTPRAATSRYSCASITRRWARSLAQVRPARFWRRCCAARRRRWAATRTVSSACSRPRRA